MRSPAAVQAMLLQSARCLVSLGQLQPAVSCHSWPQLHQVQQLSTGTSCRQPVLQRAALPASFDSSSSSSRGFFSSIMQPDSKVYKERRLIG